MIDTHAHLYASEFDADRDEMMQRSLEAGVVRTYMPNIDRTSIDAMLATEARYGDRAVPMMGLHPCSVKKDFEKELEIVERLPTRLCVRR